MQIHQISEDTLSAIIPQTHPIEISSNQIDCKISHYYKPESEIHKPTGSILISKLINQLRGKQQMGDHQMQHTQVGIFKEKHCPYVNFNGVFGLNNEAENLIKHSGLICVGLKGLSPERLDKIKCNLISSKYTFLLFNSSKGDGLNIVAKINSQFTDDHVAYFKLLSRYLQLKYGLMSIEIDSRFESISHLCQLTQDPNLYYNPLSKRVNLYKQIVNKPALVNLKSQLIENSEDTYNNLTFGLGDNTDNSLDNEQITTKLLSSIHNISNWYKSKILQTQYDDNNIKSLKVGRKDRISISINEKENDIFEYNFSESFDDKIIKTYKLEHDTVTGEIEGFDKDFINSKQRKADKKSVVKFLIKILQHHEKEQGKVQEILEHEFESSSKTIRNRIKEILFEQIAVKDNNNNLFVLAKQIKKQKHYLFFKRIN